MSPAMYEVTCRHCGGKYAEYSGYHEAKCPFCGATSVGRLISYGKAFCIHVGENVIRRKHGDISVSGGSSFISKHLRTSITYNEEDKTFTINPHGIKLNGNSITKPTELHSGDELTIRRTEVTFISLVEEEPDVYFRTRKTYPPKLIKCEKCGNYYDSEDFSDCPVCSGECPFAQTTKPHGDIIRWCV